MGNEYGNSTNVPHREMVSSITAVANIIAVDRSMTNTAANEVAAWARFG